MVSTDAGKWIEFRPLLRNAFSSIVFSFESAANVTDVRELQSLNALSAMLSTNAGTNTWPSTTSLQVKGNVGAAVGLGDCHADWPVGCPVG